MLLSMTGYGRVTQTFRDKTILVEIRSLNSKFTDLRLKIPSSYREKDTELRRITLDRLERGKIDMLIEVKSVERLTPIHGKQLLTYLRLTNQPVGLLINFGGDTLKEGLRRIVNNYRPSASPRLRVNQNIGSD
jgi:GxxExxY protein